MSNEIKLGLIGAGFIGACHARAARSMPVIFGDAPLHPVPFMLAEAGPELASAKARALGFRHATDDWRRVIDRCDAVVIAVPSHLHREIALAAISAGKPVLCEKPVGLSADEAAEIAAAARKGGVAHAVGLTYVRAPLVRMAANLVRGGELGRPLHFRGWHCEDYLADPKAPYTWRLDPALAGRAGALGDLGWHILALARLFCGPVIQVTGRTETFHAHRVSDADPNETKAVGNEDWAGMLLEFADGATGTVECSRIAHGRKMDIGFELVCEGGTVAFHGERMNEIDVCRASGKASGTGFRRILCDATHPDYAAFLPAPGHGLGFNDLKVIEMRDFMQAIADGRGAAPDLDEAARIARICEAVIFSGETGSKVLDPEQRNLAASDPDAIRDGAAPPGSTS